MDGDAHDETTGARRFNPAPGTTHFWQTLVGGPMKSLLMASTLLAMTLAGCSGGGDPSICGTLDDEGRHVVCMTGANTFEPRTLEIAVGDTVVWINQGGTHNTEAEDGSWKSDIAGPDKRVNHVQTFDEAGSFDYFCLPHKSMGMIGTITVS